MTFTFGEFNFRTIDQHTCYIGTGSGDANAPIEGASYSGPAVIPSVAVDKITGKKYTVTKIHTYSFRKCNNLSGVYIPNTIIYIGFDAFACSSITNIVVPKSVEQLGNAAFSMLPELKSVVFEPGIKLKSLSIFVFSDCYKLKKIIIPPSVDSLSAGLIRYGSGNVDIYYCGSNIINDDFTAESSIKPTVYVTKNYPSDTFGGYEVVLLANESICEPYLTKIKEITCKNNKISHIFVKFSL